MSDMTTTPISDPTSAPEIEGAVGHRDLLDTQNGPAASMVEEWRRFAAFLRRPSLDVSEQNSGALTVLARIYALDILAMAVLVGLASALVAAGVYIPETAIAGMEFTPMLILGAVVAAPVMEEIAFRAWLSGKLGHMVGLVLLGLGAFGFTLAHMGQVGDNIALAIGGIALGVTAPILAIFAFVRGTRAEPMGWFVKTFAVWFWLSTVAFALVHLANFDEGSLAVLLPLVLPQFILGSMLGYVRVRFGLWSAIALHAAHNGTAVAIAALAGQLS